MQENGEVQTPLTHKPAGASPLGQLAEMKNTRTVDNNMYVL